jgi:hypothetical protein
MIQSPLSANPIYHSEHTSSSLSRHAKETILMVIFLLIFLLKIRNISHFFILLMDLFGSTSTASQWVGSEGDEDGCGAKELTKNKSGCSGALPSEQPLLLKSGNYLAGSVFEEKLTIPPPAG